MNPIERLKELHEKSVCPLPLSVPEDYPLRLVCSGKYRVAEGLPTYRTDYMLIAATRNLLPELIALWEAVKYGDDSDLSLALRRLDSRAEEILGSRNG